MKRNYVLSTPLKAKMKREEKPMTTEYVKRHISPEVMEQMRKEYPNKTDEEIIEAMTKVFNQVGSIVINLVSQVWEVLKETTKGMTEEEIREHFKMRTKKHNLNSDVALENALERVKHETPDEYAERVLKDIERRSKDV